MAALVASQCSVPIKSVTLFERSFQGFYVNNFLDNALCLGDILQAEGYINIFMGGAPISYAGRSNFLTTHGYTEVYGKNDWKDLGETQFNDWGLYDDRLIYQAKEKIKHLETQSTPYNLTLLTVDTHFPSVSYETCQNEVQKR